MRTVYSAMSLATGGAPAGEPVTMDEARSHCRLDDTDSDDVLAGLIAAARQYVEGVTRLALLTQTWDVTFPRFGDVMQMPKSPLQSVSSIKYLDEDGVQQTLASSVYRTTGTEPGVITLDEDQEWPSVQPVVDPVTIQIVCGYGTRTAVPATLRHAIKLLVGHWFENRENAVYGMGQYAETPLAVDSLLSLHRIEWV